MRKWILLVVAIATLSGPAMAKATAPVATGVGSVNMLESDQPTDVYQFRYYTLVGTFTVGLRTYTGTVTGTWSQDLYQRTGSFSGSNGKHTFSASDCDFRTGTPGSGLDPSSTGRFVSGRSELYTCSANIDGGTPTQLALLFEYLNVYPTDQVCCRFGYKGVFVGI